MRINRCRLCGKACIKSIFSLGYQKYTGVFPQKGYNDLSGGVLELVKCCDKEGCGLVQLAESFNSEEMYGENYGYHSSLNAAMVRHLEEISDEIINQIAFEKGDVILDIGSNDGTLLGIFQKKIEQDVGLVGIDPSGGKFRNYYKEGVVLIDDFFSANSFKTKMGNDKKAKVVTSIAMFYDLEDPISFARDVESILDNNGIWVIEQSYLPLMISTSSYDTICHEHIEFYSFKQIEYIADKANLKIIDVSKNDTNGGSFRVTMCKSKSVKKQKDSVFALHKEEIDEGVDNIEYFSSFTKRIIQHRTQLLDFLKDCKEKNKTVLGYGASTKGNVVLQYCGIDESLIKAIVEVNPDKFGCVTPGTNIPIISEEEGKRMCPDYYVVLPWHFKDTILLKESDFRRETKTRFVFYLPEFQVY